MTNSTSITLIALGGSLRERSYSRAALEAALRHAQAQGIHTELFDLRQLNLPMFVPDQALADYPAEHQANLRTLLDGFRRANIMLWSSPTYHGTVSGVFKNALDFVELLADDAAPYLTGQAVGLISINDSSTFAAMRDCVHELRAWLTPTQVLLSGRDFNPDLTISNERLQKRLERMVAELIAFARKHRE